MPHFSLQSLISYQDGGGGMGVASRPGSPPKEINEIAPWDQPPCPLLRGCPFLRG